MLRHVVLLRWSDALPERQVAAITAALRELPREIPEIRAYAVGADLRLVDGSWDYAIVADFDDAEGWRRYDTYPEHVRVRTELIAPWVAERASVRFAIDR